MTVLFHGNFALNRPRMAKLLKLSLAKPSLNDAELAKSFGYGAPFSKLYRSWLHKTGMINLRLPVELTDLGQVVWDKDPEFESDVTAWFLHHQLTTDPERAEAWSYFASDFLPKHKSFSKSDLIEGLTEKLRYHSEMHFGPGSKLNKQIAIKILQVYTDSEGLGGLNLITEVEGSFVRGVARKVGPWNTKTELEAAFD